MNIETQILLGAVSIGAVSLVVTLVCFFKQRKNRSLIELTNKQIEELENSLAENKTIAEAASQRAADQSRRIAWLETRIRQPKLAKKDVLDEETLIEKSNAATKANITERRHRVLALAKSGQNAETIAATLGMLPGEVELIINLNRANFAQFA